MFLKCIQVSILLIILIHYTFTTVVKDNRLKFLSNKSLKLVCYTVEMIQNSYTMDNEHEGFIVLEFRQSLRVITSPINPLEKPCCRTKLAH